MKEYFIPSQIKAAFQSREDTLTGKLSYLTFIDRKGKLKNSCSWTSWGELPDETIENKPVSGFILGDYLIRGIGTKYLSYWIRLSDPRGFDVEISIDNFMYILNHEGLIKETKELTGKFAYGWLGEGKGSMWLLPCCSNDYIDSLEESKKLCSEKLTKNSLIPGAKYLMDNYDKTEVIFIGNFRLMKNFGKSYETVPLFIKQREDLLFYIEIYRLKYIIKEDVLDSERIKEISKIFEETAYSKTFWDNISSGIIQKFIPLENKKFYSESGGSIGIDYWVWIRPNSFAELELGIIEDSGKTLRLGKPLYLTDGSYGSLNKITLKHNIPSLEIKNNSVSILDKIGQRENRYDTYSRGNSISDLYPNCTDTTVTPVKYNCIPGYVTTSGYTSDSLFYLARCDSFDKASRLKIYKL